MKSNETRPEPGWLSSNEARRALRISSCQLMHLRVAGVLRFTKRGNAYLYGVEDVMRRAASHARGEKTWTG